MMGSEMFSDVLWTFLDVFRCSHDFLATLSDPKLLSNGSVVSDYAKELDDF